MKEYVNIQDDDSHWYYMPKDRVDDFKRLLWDSDNTGLECWERPEWREFEGYMTGGGPRSHNLC